jgi:type I restriction enzyme R subunit
VSALDKRLLSERDICTKYVTPAIGTAGWDVMTQVREEVYFTKGRVIVQGKTVKRGEAKRADYLLHDIPNPPIAIIEVKDSNHSVGDGMQQALDYGTTLDVPFVFSTNGDAFLEHDRTVTSGTVERELPLAAFPSPAELWDRYCRWKGLTGPQQVIVSRGHRDRQDVHRVPDHLAALESRRQETHLVPGRP